MEQFAPHSKPYLLIAVTVLAACWMLFALDKDTHNFADLLKPGNLVALAIYYLPTFLISIALLRLFARRGGSGRSIVLALIIGIPISFSGIIITLLLLKH